MKTTPEHDKKMATMTFASVYPHYVTKVEKKGRSIEELHQVIHWLTGFDAQKLQEMIDAKATFEDFFAAATIHPNASLIIRSNLRLSCRRNQNTADKTSTLFRQIGGRIGQR